MTNDRSSKPLNVGRHSNNCKICSHPKREEIEQDFVNWRSPAEITKTYKLSDRSTVYRHAHALNLFGRRQRNVRAALERIIEKAGDVEVTAASVVAAVQAYAKINSGGQWIDRTETVNLHDLFERMTQDELETYARDSKLPHWFTTVVSATSAEEKEHPSD
jgi:hypothetical protein